MNCPECGSARYFTGYKITGGRARQPIRQCYDCGYEERRLSEMGEKSCNGPYCMYRCQGSGATGWVCLFGGYCDYQAPRDSRSEAEKAMAQLNSSEGKKKAKQLKQLHNRVAEVLR